MSLLNYVFAIWIMGILVAAYGIMLDRSMDYNHNDNVSFWEILWALVLSFVWPITLTVYVIRQKRKGKQ